VPHEDLSSPPALTTESLAATGVGQGAFVGHLIHELRNLLAPMGNVTQLIRLRAAEDQRLMPATAMLERQIGSIGRLLEKLAAADHLLREDAVLRASPLDLRQLVADTIDANREAFESRHRELLVTLPEMPVPIEGSASHLASVLRDLLDNALRFTREHGRIHVELRVEGPEASVRVRDDGRGIAPERLPLLFRPRFSASAPLPDDRSGLGLSLATAARVMALHGGRIEARSAGPGAGSEFVLRLSTSAGAPDLVASPGLAAPTGTCAHKRVLVVDDSEAMQDSLTHMLEELGQDVRSAFDGEEALRIARDWEPDLVLLDINLPKLNGYRVAQALRAQFPPARMAMVMMAGDELVDAVRRGAQAVGVDRCIDKMQAGALLPELLSGSRA
jgi:CheY-like chemotaxis protein